MFVDDYSDSPGLPPPLLSSDEDDISPGQPIDLTISIDPDDKDFMKKVEEHIFSPEATKTHQSMELGGGRNITITSTVLTDLDSIEDKEEKPLDSTDVTPTHTANPNLVRTEPDATSLAVPIEQISEFSPVDVGSDLYNLDKTLEEVHDGMNDEESFDEDDVSYDEDEGSKGGSEEDGSSRTDDSNLEWIKCIGVFEYRLSRDITIGGKSGMSSGCGDGGDGGVVSDDELMDYGLLINELEVLLP